MSEDRKDFLQASDPDTWAKPEDTSWGDHFLRPDRPLNQRQRELCRMAAQGKRNKEICDALGYTPARVSVLLSNTKIKHEIEKHRDRLFKVDEQNRLKELSTDALDVMEKLLTDENINVKDKENAARWVLEKVTGKAAQQIDINGEIHIGSVLDKLDQIQAQRKTITVNATNSGQPNALPESESVHQDEFAEWLDVNMEKK